MQDFLWNAWYPAAWSREVSRSLIQRRLLGRLIVLYRRERRRRRRPRRRLPALAWRRCRSAGSRATPSNAAITA